MEDVKYIFGPVPSRRLGQSLGVSPIPEKTCNYNCIYCQLGRTNKMIKERKCFFPVAEIIAELKQYLEDEITFDVVSIVGEGEPTLYSELEELIKQIKELVDKPVVVITNSALMADANVRKALKLADIIMPSVDAYDQASLKAINRPCGSIKFAEVLAGLKEFSFDYAGQIWLEVMLVKGYNDDQHSLEMLKKITDQIRHDRVYVNTPVRPPAESFVEKVDDEILEKARQLFQAKSLEQLTAGEFLSEDEDVVEAILSLIRRHPMKEEEVAQFIKTRNEDCVQVFAKLNSLPEVVICEYNGEKTYRKKK